MAAKTLYMLDTRLGTTTFLELQDGGSAPGGALAATGWTLAKVAANNYSEMGSLVEQASGSFGATALPSGGPNNAVGNAWVIGPLNGSFASGNWVFTFATRAAQNATGTGRIRLRLYRGSNADGSGATQITAASQDCSILASRSTTVTSTSTLTLNPGAISNLSNEYLFIVVAFQITTAGTNNNADVLFYVGDGNVVTSDWTGAAVTAYRDVSSKLRLRIAGIRDVVARLRLVPQAYKDVTTRFRLAAIAYRDTTSRLALAVSAIRDASSRFVLVAAAPAVRDAAARVLLSVPGVRDVASRLVLQAPAATAYKDVDNRLPLRLRTLTSRPAKDALATGSWTRDDGSSVALWQALDETIPSDTDYIQSGLATTNDIVRQPLQPLEDPGHNSGFTLAWRYKKGEAAGLQVNLIVTLQAGATDIKSTTLTDIPDTGTDGSFTLTPGEVDAFRAAGGFENPVLKLEKIEV